MNECITWRILDSKLGKMIGGVTSKGCCLLEFVDRKSVNTIIQNLQKRHKLPMIHGKSLLLKQLQDELKKYFNGMLAAFTIPLDIKGTVFQLTVWQELLKIPYGETRSYSEIARSIHRSSAIRAVGRANGDNNIAIIIPCHRVIRKNGQLQGYGGGVWRKKELISLEAEFRPNFKTNFINRKLESFTRVSLEQWVNG